MCRSPEKEPFQPVQGNQAIGAGTPTLMPIMPAGKPVAKPPALLSEMIVALKLDQIHLAMKL